MTADTRSKSATPTLIRNGARPPSAIEIIERVKSDLAWMRYKQEYSEGMLESSGNSLAEALELLRDDGR